MDNPYRPESGILLSLMQASCSISNPVCSQSCSARFGKFDLSLLGVPDNGENKQENSSGSTYLITLEICYPPEMSRLPSFRVPVATYLELHGSLVSHYYHLCQWSIHLALPTVSHCEMISNIKYYKFPWRTGDRVKICQDMIWRKPNQTTNRHIILPKGKLC